ncbi:hypothetical protein Q9233_017803 [Columba guinea]|nr:hypothetical protein Q9233_017803 [Columba guinea]
MKRAVPADLIDGSSGTSWQQTPRDVLEIKVSHQGYADPNNLRFTQIKILGLSSTVRRVMVSQAGQEIPSPHVVLYNSEKQWLYPSVDRHKAFSSWTSHLTSATGFYRSPILDCGMPRTALPRQFDKAFFLHLPNIPAQSPHVQIKDQKGWVQEELGEKWSGKL